MMRGYTLIELLVVIGIISILTVIGFANYKNFSSDQITVKALGQVQTYLRLAQSNATSSTFCKDNLNVGPWSLTFKADANQVNNTISLSCGPANTEQISYTLENAEIFSIVGSDCGGSPSSLPFSISYSFGIASPTFSSAGSLANCLTSTSWIFTLRNRKDISKLKSFTLSKGGAIDVQ